MRNQRGNGIRKILVVGFLVLVFAVGAFGAGSKEQVLVGFLQKNTVDAFHRTLNNAAEDALKGLVSEGTIDDYVLLDGNTDPVMQVNQVEDLINMGVDCILVAPAEAEGCAPILTRAKEEGIPVIVVNSKTTNTDALAAAYVGSDDVFAGEMMAKFVMENIPSGGGYGHLMGVIGNSAQIQRGVGLHNILDKSSKWKMLDEQTAEWQAEKAIKFAEDWLQLYGNNLKAIICDNDDMSSAVQGICNNAGRTDIISIGVDGNQGPLAMIKSGELMATVYQDGASQVTKAVELAGELIKGNSIKKEYMIDFVLVTKDNVGKYLQ